MKNIKIKIYDNYHMEICDNLVFSKKYKNKTDEELLKIKEKFSGKYVIFNKEKKKYFREYKNGKPSFTESLGYAKLMQFDEGYLERKKIENIYWENKKPSSYMTSMIFDKNKNIALQICEVLFV